MYGKTEAEKKRRQQYARTYYRSHKEKVSRYSHQYYLDYIKLGKRKEFHTKKYYQTHPLDYQKYCLAYRRKRKKLVLEHYGNKCSCCGETRWEFLCVDHINGGGRKHRESLGGGGARLYDWLIRHKFPKEFRLLCSNCNEALGHYGYCPHHPRKRGR
jgi:hypothetical protein